MGTFAPDFCDLQAVDFARFGFGRKNPRYRWGWASSIVSNGNRPAVGIFRRLKLSVGLLAFSSFLAERFDLLLQCCQSEGLHQSGPVAERLGERPIAIAADECKGNPAGSEEFGDRVDLSPTNGDIEDGGVELTVGRELQRGVQP